MGSIISAIEDKIREHGSLAKYQEYLRETAFVPESNVRPNSAPPKRYPVFTDSRGKEVFPGSVIKIIEHLGNENVNFKTGVVEWDSKIGCYGYQLDDDVRGVRGFGLVKNFVVIA